MAVEVICTAGIGTALRSADSEDLLALAEAVDDDVASADKHVLQLGRVDSGAVHLLSPAWLGRRTGTCSGAMRLDGVGLIWPHQEPEHDTRTPRAGYRASRAARTRRSSMIIELHVPKSIPTPQVSRTGRSCRASRLPEPLDPVTHLIQRPVNCAVIRKPTLYLVQAGIVVGRGTDTGLV